MCSWWKRQEAAATESPPNKDARPSRALSFYNLGYTFASIESFLGFILDNRDFAQARREEPRIEPVIDGMPRAAPSASDYPDMGEIPAWLKEPEADPSLLARYGRPALAWGAALVAIAAVAAGAMWLRGEQKAHSELDAIAMSSRAADAAIAAAPAPAVVPERRNVTVPPLVTLAPPGGVAPGSTTGAPVSDRNLPALAVQAPVVTEAPAVAPVTVAPTPRAAPVKRPVVAKAPVKRAAKAPARKLAATKWPPAPSRTMPLAQNVVPKVKGKATATPKRKLAAAARKAKGAAKPRPKVLAAAARKAQAKKAAGAALPPQKLRTAQAPAPREYPRDPVPIPRSCARGELARDCAN